MRINEVRKLLHAQPFRPFVICVANGGPIPVKHEDFVAISPTGREMHVYLPNGDYEVVDVMLITRLLIATRNGAGKGSK